MVRTWIAVAGMLAFAAGCGGGTGSIASPSTVGASYPPTDVTWYVVVHAGPDVQGLNANYLLRGNLFA